MFSTIQAIKDANANAGYFFFEPDTLRFFRSRILPTVHPVPNGGLFVTSEQFEDSRGNRDARKYTIRFAHDSGKIESVGEFQTWSGSRTAQRVAASFAGFWQDTTTLGVWRNPKNLKEMPVIVVCEHRNPDGEPNGIVRFMLTTCVNAPRDGGKINLVTVTEF